MVGIGLTQKWSQWSVGISWHIIDIMPQNHSVLMSEEGTLIIWKQLKLKSTAVWWCHWWIKWISSSVCVKVSLCLWVGGCRHGVDFHVLSVDGFKGLVSVDHRTKHHRLQQDRGTMKCIYSSNVLKGTVHP